MSAASQLIENGITDVVILEAQNRVGGRVFTTLRGDVKGKFKIGSKKDTLVNVFSFLFTGGHPHIEMGAQWIHGQKGNPIYKLSSQLGNVALENKSEYCITISSLIFYTYFHHL